MHFLVYNSERLSYLQKIIVLQSTIEGLDLTFNPCIKGQLFEYKKSPNFNQPPHGYKDSIILLCDEAEATTYQSTECLV